MVKINAPFDSDQYPKAVLMQREDEIAKSYHGEASVQPFAPGNPVKGEAVKVTYTFQGTGVWVIANPA